MTNINKIKKDGKPKTVFELSVELIQSGSAFSANEFVDLAEETKDHYIIHFRMNRGGQNE